jgi:hypothetical protein
MPAAAVALALLQGAPPSPAAVTDVVADKVVLRAGSGETISWTFRTTAAAEVGAYLYDARDVLVRTLRAPAPLPAGDRHRLSWDGRDDEGRPAPPGYYTPALEIGAAGSRTRWDPAGLTGGSLSTATFLGYDAATGILRYAVTNPSLVRIHIGLNGDGPLMRTLVDWVARGPGEKTERWDGWDDSGVVQLGGSPDLDVQVWAHDLPVNAVVVEPAPGTSTEAGGPARMAFLEFPPGRARRPAGAARPHEMYNHWLHPRDRCRNPRAALEAGPGGAAPRGGAADLSEPLPLRLRLDPEEAALLHDERFEVVVYLDGTFVFEEEQGYLPFTWTLRPEMVTPGEHVVTFMIRGYEGHFGSASIRVRRPAVSAAGPVGRN